MTSPAQAETAHIRVRTVLITDNELSVALMDGRSISVPLAWYPRLANATAEQRSHWEIARSGYGSHWPEIDEDSTEGLLCGTHTPLGSGNWRSKL
jgi:Protein of unknown function (DUF2442)